MAPNHVANAYRRLYKEALRAVQYSSPDKYQVRNILQRAFRSETLTSFDPTRIRNTVRFLQRARASTGIEHKILKNLCFQDYWRHKDTDPSQR
jgi:hypothetical protein